MLGKDKVLCKTNYVQNKHNLYYKWIFLCMCIRGPAKSQMTFDLQTILVQDQTFHLFNHAQKVDPTAGFSICAFKHIFVLYEDLRTCCLNVSSLGGSLTKVESLTVFPILPAICSDRYGIVSTFPSDHTALILVFGLDRLNHSIRDKSLN